MADHVAAWSNQAEKKKGKVYTSRKIWCALALLKKESSESCGRHNTSLHWVKLCNYKLYFRQESHNSFLNSNPFS